MPKLIFLQIRDHLRTEQVDEFLVKTEKVDRSPDLVATEK